MHSHALLEVSGAFIAVTTNELRLTDSRQDAMDGEDGAKRCLQSDALQPRSFSKRCDSRALSYQDTAFKSSELC